MNFSEEKFNIDDVLKRLIGSPKECGELISVSLEREAIEYAIIHQTCAVMLGLEIPLNEEAETKLALLTGAEVPFQVLEYLNSCVTSSEFKKSNLFIKNLLVVYYNSAKLFHLLGVCHFSMGMIEEARNDFERSLELNANNPQALNNLGLCFSRQGAVETALLFYKNSVEQKFGFFDPINNVCDILERTNRITELETWITEIKGLHPLRPDSFNYYEAKFLYRKHRYIDAIKILENVIIDQLPNNLRARSISLQANTYEKLGESNAAFFKFSKMNKLVSEQKHFPAMQSKHWLRNYTKLRSILMGLQTLTLEKASTEKYAPVFFVGFPRSGTTLVDMILRSHSRISVIEEKPCLNIAKASVFSDDDFSYLHLPQDADEFSRVRERYFREQVKYSEKSIEKIIIDKLPLNLLETAFIRKAFPTSKIILAVRHPLDCVFSSWVQDFEINVAMAHFTDLKKSTDLYNLGMDIFFLVNKLLCLNYHIIRYENLVQDLEREIKKLLSFLDVEWQDDLNSYRDTALNRGQINTPSYSQVINPINQQAKFRYKKYLQHLNLEQDKLKRWIDYFGYRI